MKHLGALGLLITAVAALPSMAQAQAAYTSKDAHLRAGPAREYLSIAILPSGFQISVQGCLSNYTWCDVIAGPDRGWIYAANIVYPYQNAYVPVLNYGAVIGLAVIGFVIGDYWTNHYRDRPWYSERYRWINRPVAPPMWHRPLPSAHPPPVTRPGVQRPPPTPRSGPGAPRRPPSQGTAPSGQRPHPPRSHEPGGQTPRSSKPE